MIKFNIKSFLYPLLVCVVLAAAAEAQRLGSRRRELARGGGYEKDSDTVQKNIDAHYFNNQTFCLVPEKESLEMKGEPGYKVKFGNSSLSVFWLGPPAVRMKEGRIEMIVSQGFHFLDKVREGAADSNITFADFFVAPFGYSANHNHDTNREFYDSVLAGVTDGWQDRWQEYGYPSANIVTWMTGDTVGSGNSTEILGRMGGVNAHNCEWTTAGDPRLERMVDVLSQALLNEGLYFDGLTPNGFELAYKAVYEKSSSHRQL